MLINEILFAGVLYLQKCAVTFACMYEMIFLAVLVVRIQK